MLLSGVLRFGTLGLGMLCLGVLVFSAPQAQAQEPTPAEAPAPPAGEDPPGEAPLDLAEDEEFLEQIQVFQQKPFMRKLRFELAPIVGLSVNDSLVLHYSVGAIGRFHINEQFAVGLSYRKYFHEDRGVVDDVENEMGVFPERRFRDYYAGAEFSYTPIYGKFMLFDAIVHMDAYLTAGVGTMRTWEVGAEGENLVSWNIGVGTRLVLTEWLALNLELRDYMYIEPYRAGDSFVNDVVLHGGISVFMPFKHAYVYPK